MIAIDLDVEMDKAAPVKRRAAQNRTARRLFDGHAHVPAAVWHGVQPADSNARPTVNAV
jgi:hypothetical protein